MLIDLIERYGSIVQSWTVTHFDREGDDFRLKAQVLFVDGVSSTSGRWSSTDAC
jgi:hypothetical protein